jgi:hypothetical protein
MQPTPMHQSIHRPINPVAKMICQGGVKPWTTSCRNLGENIAECLGNFIGIRKRLTRHWPSRCGPKQVCDRAAPHLGPEAACPTKSRLPRSSSCSSGRNQWPKVIPCCEVSLSGWSSPPTQRPPASPQPPPPGQRAVTIGDSTMAASPAHPPHFLSDKVPI